jgi:hypothetical protein
VVQASYKDQTEEPQCHNPSESRDGSASLLDNEHVLVPFKHGHHGRERSTEEAGEELLGRVEGKLHGLAGGPVRELQIRTSGAPSAGCEHCQLGMELLFELFEQREMNNWKPGVVLYPTWTGVKAPKRCVSITSCSTMELASALEARDNSCTCVESVNPGWAWGKAEAESVFSPVSVHAEFRTVSHHSISSIIFIEPSIEIT